MWTQAVVEPAGDLVAELGWMFVTGSRTVGDLRNAHAVGGGPTRQYLEARGITDW